MTERDARRMLAILATAAAIWFLVNTFYLPMQETTSMKGANSEAVGSPDPESPTGTS